MDADVWVVLDLQRANTLAGKARICTIEIGRGRAD